MQTEWEAPEMINEASQSKALEEEEVKEFELEN